MKVLLICSILYLISISLCFGQRLPERNEIQIGFTPWSNPFSGSDLFKNVMRSFVGDRYHFTTLGNSVNVTYRFTKSQNFKLGMVVGAAWGERTDNFLRFSSNNDFRYRTMFTAFEPTFIYKQSANLTMYGNAGLGVTLVSQKYLDSYTRVENTGFITYQMTPIAIRYGKKLGVFMEVGYGYKGIVNMGISTKF